MIRLMVLLAMIPWFTVHRVEAASPPFDSFTVQGLQFTVDSSIPLAGNVPPDRGIAPDCRLPAAGERADTEVCPYHLTANCQLPAKAAAPPPSASKLKTNWQAITDTHFIVAFTEKDRKIAETALLIANNFCSQINLSLGDSAATAPLSPVYIIIAPSREVFEKLSGLTEEWAVGLAAGGSTNNRIVILSPRMFGSRSEIERLIRHEYTHIFLNRFTDRYRVPRWLNEGLAMYHESNAWRIPDNICLTEAVLTHSLLPLDLLGWYFPSDRKRAELAYAQSLDITAYIIKEYGYEGVRQLIREIAKGNDLDAAIWKSLGISPPSLEAAWHTSLRKRYSFLSLLTDATIWSILPIICIIAYIRKVRQAERKKRQWEIEDGVWPSADISEDNSQLGTS